MMFIKWIKGIAKWLKEVENLNVGFKKKLKKNRFLIVMLKKKNHNKVQMTRHQEIPPLNSGNNIKGRQWNQTIG